MELGPDDVASSAECSAFGIMHLKRYLQKCLLDRENKLSQEIKHGEWMIDNTLLNALGLELAQTISFIFMYQPSIQEFENWIKETAGVPGSLIVERFNDFVRLGGCPMYIDEQYDEAVLTAAEIDHWNKFGYIIVKKIVSKSVCDEAVKAICEYLNVDRYNPARWQPNPLRVDGIKVKMFHHAVFDQLRQDQRIRIVFEQLWKRKDIWLKTDTAGYSPPETGLYGFPGHQLHWDVSLQMPIPFSTQALIYLTDTKEDQGPLALVPGFQHQIGEWLSSLPKGVDPRNQDLWKLGARKITADAGDMIIWQQALPHGSTPNRSNQPRFVQYINYLPAEREIQTNWI